MSAVIGEVSVTWNSAAIHAEPPSAAAPCVLLDGNHNEGNRAVGQSKDCQVPSEKPLSQSIASGDAARSACQTLREYFTLCFGVCE